MYSLGFQKFGLHRPIGPGLLYFLLLSFACYICWSAFSDFTSDDTTILPSIDSSRPH